MASRLFSPGGQTEPSVEGCLCLRGDEPLELVEAVRPTVPVKRTAGLGLERALRKGNLRRLVAAIRSSPTGTFNAKARYFRWRAFLCPISAQSRHLGRRACWWAMGDTVASFPLAAPFGRRLGVWAPWGVERFSCGVGFQRPASVGVPNRTGAGGARSTRVPPSSRSYAASNCLFSYRRHVVCPTSGPRDARCLDVVEAHRHSRAITRPLSHLGL
jgi:hypothetical protein